MLAGREAPIVPGSCMALEVGRRGTCMCVGGWGGASPHTGLPHPHTLPHHVQVSPTHPSRAQARPPPSLALSSHLQPAPSLIHPFLPHTLAPPYTPLCGLLPFLKHRHYVTCNNVIHMINYVRVY